MRVPVQIPFAASPRASVGIEWELQLVDVRTRQLRPEASKVLAELPGTGPGGEHPKVKHELMESTLELNTGVCGSVPEAVADLARSLAEVGAVAGPRGLALACSGTHPFSDWRVATVSPNARYLQLVDDLQWLARRIETFAVHVHVGVRSVDKAIPILNALTAYLPHFLALSASSPFWVGGDTGLASSRSVVFGALPTAGPPARLDDWAEFEAYMQTLLRAGAIRGIKEVWWDVRPHPDFGTVEIRVCDGLPTMREVSMVAALAQCLVVQLDGQLDRGYTLPKPAAWVVRENKWRATRYGLDARVITDEAGTTTPLRALIAETAAELAPMAARLGCAEELAVVGQVLERGASYQRQREVVAAGGRLEDVVDDLLEELRSDRLTPRRPAPAGR